LKRIEAQDKKLEDIYRSVEKPANIFVDADIDRRVFYPAADRAGVRNSTIFKHLQFGAGFLARGLGQALGADETRNAS